MIKKSNLSFSDRHALEAMGKDLNSKVHEYNGDTSFYKDEDVGQADIIYRDPEFKDMGLYKQQRENYLNHEEPAVSRAVKQIRDFGGSSRNANPMNSNTEDNSEFHYVISKADKTNVPELHRGLVIYRKLEEEHPDPRKIYPKGKIIKLNASSTSSDPDIANSWHLTERRLSKELSPEQIREEFSDSGHPNSGYSLMGRKPRMAAVTFHFSPGTQALQVAPIVGHPGQNEYIIAPGKFRVTHSTGPDEHGIHHVYLEPHRM